MTRQASSPRRYEPFDESEFARRQPVRLENGRTLVVNSPEDTVLRKLLWYRQGGEMSDPQWRDIRSVIRVSGSRVDASYLSSWGTRLAIVDLLTRAHAE
jgi:hypothetical protein